MTEKDPTLDDAIAYAYGEWQIAERDTEHADDTENHAYLTGQADAFRDMFIRLSKVANPAFDFLKFCFVQTAIDKNFVAGGGEMEPESEVELAYVSDPFDTSKSFWIVTTSDGVEKQFADYPSAEEYHAALLSEL